MIKRISRLGPAIIAGAIGLILLHTVVEAGTYKLEYPANYGCKCTPNWLHYGYFKTEWRQAPGEERPDQTFPKSIGAGVIPTPKGYEQLPLPRETIPKGPVNPPPGTETPPVLPGEQPPSEPAAPGSETLPGLPAEPGGFNPMPGFPPDTLEKPEKKPAVEQSPETPSPSEKKEPTSVDSKEPKGDAKPAANKLEIKPEATKKDESSQPSSKQKDDTNEKKSYSPTRLPGIAPTKSDRENTQAMNQTHPQANWNSALQPGIYAETSRSGAIHPAMSDARQASYQAPIDSNEIVRLPSADEQPSPEQSPSSVQNSALPTPADSRPTAAPSMALNGYCPVELCRNGRWAQGDPRWTVIHKGVIYRLSGNDQRLAFLANPEQFVPGNGGNDVVISANEQRNVAGELTYCAAFKGKVYMFSSSATQIEFQKNPERFVGEQNQNAISPSLGTSSLGVRGYQTLGRGYNQQRQGF